MKLHRKLGAALATMVALGGFVAAAPAANATPTPVNPTVCVVAGTVSLSAAVHLGGTVSTSPPGVSATVVAGTYTFVSVTIVCAGTAADGAATATSTGNYSDVPILAATVSSPIPVFTGNYNTGAFSVTGNTCNGTVNGERAGAVIAATISANCGASVLGPATSSVAGVLVLAVAPDPLTLNVNCPVVGPTTVTCDPLVNSIIVAGAAVLA
jgi:hypothetical protein